MTYRVAARTPLFLDMGYGRLYVQSPVDLTPLPGATFDREKGIYHLPLTLPTLREIAEANKVSRMQLFQASTATLQRWIAAAKATEERSEAFFAKIRDGWRDTLDWPDHQRPDAQRPPYDHQRVMASLMLGFAGCGIWGEVGTGKTRASLSAAAELVRRGEIDYVFVASKPKVIGTWAREAPMWTDGLTVVRLEDSVARRKQQLAMSHRRGTVFVTNWEAIWRMDTAIIDLCHRARVLFIGDESQVVKNAQAKTTKSTMRICQAAARRVLLTGTPVTNTELDLWSQGFCIDFGVALGANLVQFRSEYFTPGYDGFSYAPKPAAAERIRDRIKQFSVTFRKKDCLDLPPQVYVRTPVEMSRAQKDAYRQMADQLVVDLERIDDSLSESVRAEIILTQSLRLSQITSGFLPSPDGTTFVFAENPKLDALEEAVRTAAESGVSTIVWAWYKHDISTIAARLQDLSPCIITGGRSDSEHQELRFSRGDSPVMICNPASAGAGLNLQVASQAMYFSQTYNYEHRAQSEGRNHRSGSEIHERITYTDFMCQGTIDEIIVDALAGKHERAQIVTDLRHHLATL